MNRKKIATLIACIISVMCLNAQNNNEFSSLKSVSPWSVSIEGTAYQKSVFETPWSNVVDRKDIAYRPDAKNAFLGGIGVNYALNHANKYSFIFSAGLDLKPLLSIEHSEKGAELFYLLDKSIEYTNSYSPYLSFMAQYQNRIDAQEKWFYNLKVGVKLNSYYSCYSLDMNYSVGQADDYFVFQVYNNENNFSLYPSLVLGAGVSHNSSIGLFGLNVVGNISIPYLSSGRYYFKLGNSEFSGVHYLTGNYVGLSLTYSPKKCCSKSK